MNQKTPLRIYHPWWKWECYKAGFFNGSPPDGMDSDRAKLEYPKFFRTPGAFASAMERVTVEWSCSCEQFLTNPSMNRIAWLGQASVCITSGVSSKFRSGFNLLTAQERDYADGLADTFLQKWTADMVSIVDRVREYLAKWKRQGYAEDISDDAPDELTADNLAPSYKAIALALLKNDNNLESLGFVPKKSLWYSALKRIEIAERERVKERGCIPYSDLFEAIANAK